MLAIVRETSERKAANILGITHAALQRALPLGMTAANVQTARQHLQQYNANKHNNCLVKTVLAESNPALSFRDQSKLEAQLVIMRERERLRLEREANKQASQAQLQQERERLRLEREARRAEEKEQAKVKREQERKAKELAKAEAKLEAKFKSELYSMSDEEWAEMKAAYVEWQGQQLLNSPPKPEHLIEKPDNRPIYERDPKLAAEVAWNRRVEAAEESELVEIRKIPWGRERHAAVLTLTSQAAIYAALAEYSVRLKKVQTDSMWDTTWELLNKFKQFPKPYPEFTLDLTFPTVKQPDNDSNPPATPVNPPPADSSPST